MPLWRSPRARALLFQALLLAAVGLLVAAIVDNALEHLRRQGTATGLGFLDDQAGFGIILHLIEYSETSSYGRAFLVGLLNTLLVAALGVLIATVLGFVIGVARLSSNWLIRKLAAAYIETIRNIPLLLQIFFWYFAVLRPLPHPRNSINLADMIFLSNRGLYTPKPLFGDGGGWVLATLLIGVAGAIALLRWAGRRREASGRAPRVWPWILVLILGLPVMAALFAGFTVTFELPELGAFNFRGGMVLIPEFVALLAALALYTAAFIAEIVRAGIESVRKGQREAALALGLPPRLVMRKVIIPQALRVIIPPLTNQYLNLTKNSSLATAVGYPDFFAIFAGTVLNQTGQAVEVIAITMLVYLSLSLSIAAAMSVYNRRKALVER